MSDLHRQDASRPDALDCPYVSGARRGCDEGGRCYCVEPIEKDATIRWHVHVDDDIIHAATEAEARAEFIQALVEDGGLLYVSKAEAVEGSEWRAD